MSIDANQGKRCDQGRCEIELCTHAHGEADLQRAFIMCSKNPGHDEFIPVYKFRKEHLPVGFQDGYLMELIQVLSHLTVRVSVTYTSENRPQTCPHNGIPYPFYLQRDTNMVRTGTGWVWNLEKFSKMYDMKTCPCHECERSDHPETKWAEIIIASAAHVVFDDKEGKHTTCHLFYDKGSTPEVCEGVVTLRGMFRVDTNIKEDKCKMIYITHDMELADRLENLTQRFVDIQKILSQMYSSNLGSVQMQSRRGTSMSRYSSRSRRVEAQRSQAKEIVDVSQTNIDSSEKLDLRSLTHEGLQSQNSSHERLYEIPKSDISRSRDTTRKGVNSKLALNDITQAVTVPAALGNTSNNRSPLRNIPTNTAHLINGSDDKKQTQIVTDIHLPKIIVTSHNSARHRSQTRNIQSDTSQTKNVFSEKPHSQSDMCTNPHSQTTLRNILPSKSDLWKLSQSNSDESNQLNSLASDKWKLCFVDGKQSNSFYCDQSKSFYCDQSQRQTGHSQSDSRKVLTDKSPSRHPVLIRQKERNTTFQRNENTHVPRLLSLTNNINTDQSESTTARSDKTKQMITRVNQSGSTTARFNQSDLINVELSQSPATKTTPSRLEPRNDASNRQQSSHELHFQKMSHKKSQRRHEPSHEPKLILSRRTQSTDGRAATVADPALTVIVSHPHGCNKQITIGYYTERVEVKDSRNLTRYVYTTPTCPGSSGAPVYVLGRWRGWWPCDHPHSGNSDVNKELNFSGVGLH